MAVALAYAGLAALVAGESAGLPVPGETSLLASAVLAARGQLALSLVIAVAAAAAVVGDNVGYVIGRRGGRWLLTRPGRWWGARHRLLREGEVLFERHGGKAVFVSRFAPGLRVTGAWLAGASAMRWRSFVLWNALGGAVWAATVGVAGYVLGAAASRLVGAGGLVLLALVVAVALAAIEIRRRR